MASDKRQCLVTFLCGWPKPRLKKKIALPLWGVPLVIWYRPRRLTLTAWGGWWADRHSAPGHSAFGHSATGRSAFRTFSFMGHSAFWTFSFWDIQLLGHPAFETFSFWDIQLPRHSAFGTFSFWDIQLLGHSAFWTFSFWDNQLYGTSSFLDIHRRAQGNPPNYIHPPRVGNIHPIQTYI